MPTDTRPELPLTAWHVVEEGLSEEALDRLWRQQLCPALLSAAEEMPTDGSPIDPDWLATRLRSLDDKPAWSRWLGRFTGVPKALEDRFQVVLACRKVLLVVDEGDRGAAARLLHDMAEAYLAIPGAADQVQVEGFGRDAVERFAEQAIQAFSRLVPRSEREEARQRLYASLP